MDIGNRRLKWATATPDNLDGRCGALGYDEAHALPELAAQLDRLEAPESVWVSCVARREIRRAVEEYARGAWSLQPVFIAAQKQQAGVVNSYPDSAALGSDRWAALVAAADLCPRQPVIVVDAGTAVTVDLLDGAGTFRGGVIFPGVHAMRCALGNQTANIAVNSAANSAANSAVNSAANSADDAPASVVANAIATDTQGAVASGALFAAAGGINLAVARQRAVLPDDSGAHCPIIVTGGDAERIAPLLSLEKAEISIDPQLVLRGLAIIARESGA